MAKTERAQWFKMFLHQKALVDSVPDETAGKALKAAFRYFDSKEMDELDPLAFAVFSVIKPYIDESFNDYQKSVDTGRAGGKKRWSKAGDKGDSPPIGPLSNPIGVSTEADAEADAEADTEANVCKADKPPTRTRFCPPSVGDVKAYCAEKGYNIDPQRFVDYYESNGWMVGRNKMKSWQAAVRTWASKEQEKVQAVEKKKSSIADAFPPIPILG